MQPASATEQKLQLGKEYPGEKEIDIAEEIIKLLKDQMLTNLSAWQRGKSARFMQK